MDILKFILDIIVFLLSLCVLVCVHELGHMTVAKLFKVYCYEFSIGMGPAIYQKKPKKGSKQETIFSIRCLPIGGYVSMAGEEDEDGPKPDVVIPKERTIEGISHPKKALIMVAGVFVNFVVGYILFFCNYAFCPQPISSSNEVTVVKDSLIAEAGLNTGDRIVSIQQDFYIGDKVINLPAVTTENYIDISDALTYYEEDSKGNVIVDYLPHSATDHRVLTLTVIKKGETTSEVLPVITTLALEETPATDDKEAVYSYELLGVSAIQHHVGIGRAFVMAGQQWAYGCSAIFVALGSLFTPAGWSQVGGVVSMFKISSIATQSGLSVFFNLWGLISVNLAIFNLIPIPGLDGWQLLVTGIEGVSKKKVPNKVKQVMTLIGYILLFGLMIVLLFKDILFPII